MIQQTDEASDASAPRLSPRVGLPDLAPPEVGLSNRGLAGVAPADLTLADVGLAGLELLDVGSPDVVLRDVVLRDVTLRDGLQDEAPISTDQKVVIFEALVAAGVAELELTSFVRPDRVPAMADAEALCARTAGQGVIRWGLVLNERGARRALDAGLEHIQFVVSVSDSHSRDNAGRSTAEALDALAAVCLLVGDDATVELTLATTFGCPVEHRVDPDRVIEVAHRGEVAGAQSVRLADTIGTALPSEIRSIVAGVRNELSVPLGLHLHDTRGLGVANVLAGREMGIRSFDAAVGGLGGCPFAKGASGNVALEDLVHVFEESGTTTGISVLALMDVAKTACAIVGKPVSSHIGVAGPRFVNDVGLMSRPNLV